MHDECDSCGLSFTREPGYFLGSIYFNYGVTALFVTATYFLVHFGTEVPENVLVGSLGVFCVLFPMWFFRYARSLWMGFDELMDPRDGKRDA